MVFLAKVMEKVGLVLDFFFMEELICNMPLMSSEAIFLFVHIPVK